MNGTPSRRSSPQPKGSDPVEDQGVLLEQFGDALRMMYSMDLSEELPDDFEELMRALEKQPPPSGKTGV